MQRELLDQIGCPACHNFTLVVDTSFERDIEYATGRVCEVESGVVLCQTCGAGYPIEGYVLSFAERLSPSVRADGAYWGTFYHRLYDHGITGFLDTRSAPAPFLSMGVPQTLPFDGEEWGGIHVQLAEHQWVHQGGRVVDIGVGSGWSSLFLARRGFEVIAFDPALELMQLAKRYAINQGIYLEYIGADMASFHARPESIDAVFALHSLHHVPDVAGGVQQIHTMLKQGGCLALDDHFQEALLPALLRDGLLQEANATIFPDLRNPALTPEPPSHHSENEGIGMGQLLPAIERYLHIDDVVYRHIAIDFAGPLFYLEQGCDPQALAWATKVSDLLNRAMRRAWPDMVEYITLVAQKRAETPATPRYTPGPHDRFVAALEQLTAKELELQRLHATVAEKNAHIQHLQRHIERLENGRVMRLLRWLTRT
jgi:SAM-dependent methyltransferase/uncharacterized protein YbaR (Trm112 family)